MQIFGTPAATNALAQAASSTTGTTTTGSSNSATSATDSLTSESTFLQLLVAQIQNQDPLNPTDSIQFVGQLVQYSELEQLMGINQGVQTLTGDASTSTSTSSSASSTNRTSSS